MLVSLNQWRDSASVETVWCQCPCNCCFGPSHSSSYWKWKINSCYFRKVKNINHTIRESSILSKALLKRYKYFQFRYTGCPDVVLYDNECWPTKYDRINPEFIAFDWKRVKIYKIATNTKFFYNLFYFTADTKVDALISLYMLSLTD